MKHLLAALVTLLTVQNLVLGSAPACPRRYLRRINGKCYYFSVTRMNWFGALNNCLRKGLTLADLSNPGDFDGAIGFLSSLGNTEDFWFGGNDLYHEGRFQYISNGRLVRYYSNFSNVLPAEHSECDDCLEVRIRGDVNMVAADNCQERQYFICSERYCQAADESRKPRHHSHEHLHHFHHDIGDSDEEGEEDEGNGRTHNNMLPIASGSKEHADDSEAAIGAEDVPDADPLDSTTTAGSSTTPAPAGNSTTGGETVSAATTLAAGGSGVSEATTAAGETTTNKTAAAEDTTAAEKETNTETKTAP